MNERLQILRLLEEGKINAEEAARLLEALNQSETKEKKKGFWSSLEGIPDLVSSAIAKAFKHHEFTSHVAKQNLSFNKKNKIEFKGISGDLEINGRAIDTIEIKEDGFVKIKEKVDELVINALSGDLRIDSPESMDYEIKGVSGDINISRIKGCIDIGSVSGDITGKSLSGSFVGDFVSGDVDLDYDSVEEIKIKARSGNITLRLNKDVNAEIDIETKSGNIRCDLELKEEEKQEHRLRGIINKTGARIEINNTSGNVEICKK